MCGFAGFLDGRGRGVADEWRAIASDMGRRLVHRGPDDHGVWTDHEAGIALAHQRLAVIDPSPDGHQPMLSAHGRYVLVYNGEVYNFQEIRRELEALDAAPPWRGHCDTEVILAAVSHWGVEESLRRFNGMFAFALWDRRERTLFLARDRFGEKPLYYGRSCGVFLFGSELKALREHPSWEGRIDRGALALLLRHNYIPAPHSIYRNIFKLPPGCFLRLGMKEAEGSGSGEISSYWSVKKMTERAVRDPLRGPEEELLERLEGALLQAVGLRMVADVPLGAFLSGGVDSSAVVALMQAQSTRPVKTFSIGFEEKSHDEAVHAKAVARHLGTDHTELYVTSRDAIGVIPHLSELYDEPFSDSSQIPTFLVSQMTRQHVTVSLSGDGGDELFGGYTRYLLASRIHRSLSWMPPIVRRSLGGALLKVSPGTWEQVLRTASPLLPSSLRHATPGRKIQKLGEALAHRTPDELYRRLISHWHHPTRVVLGASEPPTVHTDPAARPDLEDFRQRMMYFDLVGYLPDDILVKVDRASMAVSLEARVPLLDPHLVELAWRLPMRMKIRDGVGKWALRQVLYRYVPPELIERPKMGFAIPLHQWLRGPLRDWAEALLDERRLAAEGFFDPQPIVEKWREHLSGEHDWDPHLWDVLMFQAWYEAQGNLSSEPAATEHESVGRHERV